MSGRSHTRKLRRGASRSGLRSRHEGGFSPELVDVLFTERQLANARERNARWEARRAQDQEDHEPCE